MESCGARMADADKTSATWLKVKLIVSGYSGIHDYLWIILCWSLACYISNFCPIDF